MKFNLINPSDAYTMEAEDLEVAAVAVCFLGAGRYALEGIGEDQGQDVPIFLFNGHDEWFTEKFGMNFEGTSNRVVDHRAEALAAAAQVKSVTEVRPLFSVPIAPQRELPRLPTPRLLASGTIAGKRIELHGWHTNDIEIWERQHGLKFSA